MSSNFDLFQSNYHSLTSNKISLTYFLQVTKIMISNTNSLYKNMATLNKKFLAVLVSSMFFLNWDSFHARLNSHYEGWGYK